MIKSVLDLDVSGKRLVVRADLNAPMEAGKVSDATRITRFAQGMKPLLAKGASLVVLSHFGRPKNGPDPSLSLQLLQADLEQDLGTNVAFATMEVAEQAAKELKAGQVLLIENLRFDPQEEKNGIDFARQLAALGDIYVNDAFSCAHRAHASTEAIAHLMPAVAGPLMIEEISALEKALEAPAKPAVAIVGGAKVSTKIAVLKNLVTKLDHVIVGGGMANTFLFAQGAPMGKSLHESDQLSTVNEIMEIAQKSGCTIHIPCDVVVAHEFRAHAKTITCLANTCPDDAMILDAGPRSIEAFEKVVASAKTVLWNGPLGAFEIPPFDKATIALARVVADLTVKGKMVSVAGGGDTVAALNAAGVTQDFSYVSSAGGAFLEWLEGKNLPGIAALTSGKKINA